MRRLFPSIMVVLVLLNVLGYYGLFVGMEYKNTLAVTQRLDSNNYSEEDAITIKIPVAVPYASNGRDFERVDGKFEHNGQVYRMVKQKLSNDTLYVVCLRDSESTHIQHALTDYVKTFADAPADSKQNAKSFSFIKEYVVRGLTIAQPSTGWQRELSGRYSSPVGFTDSYCSSIVHPPERV